jgi:hypothetical protein
MLLFIYKKNQNYYRYQLNSYMTSTLITYLYPSIIVAPSCNNLCSNNNTYPYFGFIDNITFWLLPIKLVSPPIKSLSFKYIYTVIKLINYYSSSVVKQIVPS